MLRSTFEHICCILICKYVERTQTHVKLRRISIKHSYTYDLKVPVKNVPKEVGETLLLSISCSERVQVF